MRRLFKDLWRLDRLGADNAEKATCVVYAEAYGLRGTDLDRLVEWFDIRF